MKGVASDIEQDRRTLLDLMERIGTHPNPVKQAVGWLTEKASRVSSPASSPASPTTGRSWRSRASCSE
jgi:hypothetical protein